MRYRQTRLVVLAGRVAVVAEGAGGIGSGDRVASPARRGDGRLRLDRPGHEGPAGTCTIACDPHEIRRGRRRASGVRLADGRLDIVVHAAGTTRDGVIWKIADDDWADVMRVNLDSAFFMRAAVPHLREPGGGAVVAFVDQRRARQGRPVELCREQGRPQRGWRRARRRTLRHPRERRRAGQSTRR
ncbi:MAG: SDR family oxidoreductase [Vicinamibacterales bacterium]